MVLEFADGWESAPWSTEEWAGGWIYHFRYDSTGVQTGMRYHIKDFDRCEQCAR